MIALQIPHTTLTALTNVEKTNGEKNVSAEFLNRQITKNYKITNFKNTVMLLQF